MDRELLEIFDWLVSICSVTDLDEIVLTFSKSLIVTLKGSFCSDISWMSESSVGRNLPAFYPNGLVVDSGSDRADSSKNSGHWRGDSS